MEGGLRLKISELGLSLGISQNKDAEAFQPCSFFFLLSSPHLLCDHFPFFSSISDLFFSNLCSCFLCQLTSLCPFSGTFYYFQFCGNVAPNKALDNIETNGTLD